MTESSVARRAQDRNKPPYDAILVEFEEESIQESFQDALDSCYYEHLDHGFTGYEVVAPNKFLDQLKVVWCRLDTRAIKNEGRALCRVGLIGLHH